MHTFARLALLGSVTVGFAVAACGGDVVVDDDSSGSGGSGASSSTSPSSSSSSSSSSGLPSTVSSSSGISTSTGPCQTCGEALAVAQIPAGNVCPGQSLALYDALVSCLCADVCAGACADTLCLNNGVSDACGGCIQSSCFSQFNDCANDF